MPSRIKQYLVVRPEGLASKEGSIFVMRQTFRGKPQSIVEIDPQRWVVRVTGVKLSRAFTVRSFIEGLRVNLRQVRVLDLRTPRVCPMSYDLPLPQPKPIFWFLGTMVVKGQLVALENRLRKLPREKRFSALRDTAKYYFEHVPRTREEHRLEIVRRSPRYRTAKVFDGYAYEPVV